MSDEKRENIFEILDGMMHHLSNTKKMFMFMILTVLILSPVALLVVTAVFDPPINQSAIQIVVDAFNPEILSPEESGEGEHGSGDSEHGSGEGESGDDDSGHLVRLPQFIILLISLVWLGIGIRQWKIVSKWDKKYQKFKEEMKDIDRELAKGSKNTDKESDEET